MIWKLALDWTNHVYSLFIFWVGWMGNRWRWVGDQPPVLSSGGALDRYLKCGLTEKGDWNAHTYGMLASGPGFTGRTERAWMGARVRVERLALVRRFGGLALPSFVLCA